MKSAWASMDAYFAKALIAPDDALTAALATSDAAGLPAIQVTEAQGKFLALLVELAGARRVLEIGTLGGYSTIWMARALPPDGAGCRSSWIRDTPMSLARTSRVRDWLIG